MPIVKRVPKQFPQMGVMILSLQPRSDVCLMLAKDSVKGSTEG